ncbi:PREDICTED: flocculation protein FLO11-like [Branchiostoma belcheri]|uniref:Flocculation protein FLO11-like n=1 Tax=Branchiostoma belcheri TaxID=7741 RepID=A0A6P4XVM5_BRABE|nr:PREDICTED: flocculation protein FLO11-like [Branchiostoma belcheri]
MESFVTVCTLVLIVQHLPPGESTTWSCDFETSDHCGYTQDTTDDLNWTRHFGQTPTANTGPSVDHTLGTGYYMYLETSVGNPGDVARLVSTPLPAISAPYCLSFYYHMFGDSMGTLNVYIRKQGIMGPSVWTVSGDQRNAWHFGHAQLDGSSSFNVIFEAVRGNDFRGDIAIDDVTVSDECGLITTTVLPTTTPYPLASPNCTFEASSICGYRQDIHDSAQWTWHQGQTDTGYTGPIFDHTLGTAMGHYMYFEASDLTSGVIVRLLSPAVPIISSAPSNTGYCLTFWYHMYGLHIGTLNVNQKCSGGSEVPIWSLSDEQGNVWRQGQLPLDGTAEFTVVFEAVRGSSYKGDIAIDDVDVAPYRGQCEFIPSSAMVPLPSTSTITTALSSTSAHLSTSGITSVATTAEQPSTAMSTSTTDRISSATTVTVVPPTPSIATQWSSTINSFIATETLFGATAEQPSTAKTTETSSTTDRISSATTVPVVPPTPTTINLSVSTSANPSRPGQISVATTEQPSTVMPTETPSTTDRISSATTVTVVPPSTITTTSLSTSAQLSTSEKTSVATTTTEQPSTVMPTETPSTTDRISSATTVTVVPPPTITTQSHSTSAKPTTSGQISVATKTEQPSTVIPTETSSTTDRISSATTVPVVPPTPTTINLSVSTNANPSRSGQISVATTEQPSTVMSTETPSTTDRISSATTVTVVPPSTITTTSLSTSAQLSTSEKTSMATTTTEQPSTVMPTETPSTTDRISSATTVPVVPPTPTITQSHSTSANPSTSRKISVSTTAGQTYTAKTTETSSTTNRTSSVTAVTAVPSTPIIITQSHGTRANSLTSGLIPVATTTEQQSTEMPIETSSTTVRISSAISVPAALPTSKSITQSHSTSANPSTSGQISVSTKAGQPSTAKTTETSPKTDHISSVTAVTAVPSTPNITTPSSSVHPLTSGIISLLTTTEQPYTAMPTETSSTTGRISLATTLTITAATPTPATNTQSPSTTAHLLTSSNSRGESSTRLLTETLKTDGTTTIQNNKSHRQITTSSMPSAGITRFGTAASAAEKVQTNNAATTTIITLAVVLSLVCGLVAGALITVLYKKRKKARPGHGRVKYLTEEHGPDSADDPFPASAVTGRVDFENPAFEHIYEELPNLVVNHTTSVDHTASPPDQRPSSGASSSQTAVYMEIKDNEVSWVEASSQQPVPSTKADCHMHISSTAKANNPFNQYPRQMNQKVRVHSGHSERSTEERHTRPGYQRDSLESENDYTQPTCMSEQNVHGPNLSPMKNIEQDADEEYEDVIKVSVKVSPNRPLFLRMRRTQTGIRVSGKVSTNI